MPCTTQRPRRRPTDGWELIEAIDAKLDTAVLDLSLYEPIFFDFVARCRSPLERDCLLAHGLSVFGYRLSAAVRAVEERILSGMLRQSA